MSTSSSSHVNSRSSGSKAPASRSSSFSSASKDRGGCGSSPPRGPFAPLPTSRASERPARPDGLEACVLSPAIVQPLSGILCGASTRKAIKDAQAVILHNTNYSLISRIPWRRFLYIKIATAKRFLNGQAEKNRCLPLDVQRRPGIEQSERAKPLGRRSRLSPMRARALVKQVGRRLVQIVLYVGGVGPGLREGVFSIVESAPSFYGPEDHFLELQNRVPVFFAHGRVCLFHREAFEKYELHG